MNADVNGSDNPEDKIAGLEPNSLADELALMDDCVWPSCDCTPENCCGGMEYLT
jgi:hypothetical protein